MIYNRGDGVDRETREKIILELMVSPDAIDPISLLDFVLDMDAELTDLEEIFEQHGVAKWL